MVYESSSPLWTILLSRGLRLRFTLMSQFLCSGHQPIRAIGVSVDSEVSRRAHRIRDHRETTHLSHSSQCTWLQLHLLLFILDLICCTTFCTTDSQQIEVVEFKFDPAVWTCDTPVQSPNDDCSLQRHCYACFMQWRGCSRLHCNVIISHYNDLRCLLQGVYTIQQTSSKLPANVHQTFSISTRILNTFAGSLLDRVNTPQIAYTLVFPVVG